MDLKDYIGEEGLDQIRGWAHGKEIRNRRMNLHCLDDADDFFQEAYRWGLELVNVNAMVIYSAPHLISEMIRLANKALTRPGTTNKQGGDELPIDPDTICETVVDESGVRRQEWFLFMADAEQALDTVPVLWQVFKELMKNHPVSRREYLMEYKRRQRLPEDWGDGDDAPKIPGYTLNGLAHKFGVHRNTMLNFRTRIKTLLKTRLANTYPFLNAVLYIVEMA